MASLSAADMSSCRDRGNWMIFSVKTPTWISIEQGGSMKTKISAIIQSKNASTLVLDFPRSIYDLYEKLQSVGVCQSPHRIPLSDEDGDDVRVKLYSGSELGKHLLLTPPPITLIQPPTGIPPLRRKPPVLPRLRGRPLRLSPGSSLIRSRSIRNPARKKSPRRIPLSSWPDAV